MTPRNEESPGAATPELSDITQNPTKGLNSMTNIVDLTAKRKSEDEIRRDYIKLCDMLYEGKCLWAAVRLLRNEMCDDTDSALRNGLEMLIEQLHDRHDAMFELSSKGDFA